MSNHTLFVAFCSLSVFLGLMIGSFLNVVIYRFPIMLDAQWKAEIAEMSGVEPERAEVFNLMLPRSRCPKCGHQIAWYENIPVLSYLFLRGKCSDCRTPISIRYPLVELATGALFLYCALRWGMTGTSLVWAGFTATLVTLTLIDWDTTLLPDDITLPLLWSGLIAAALNLTPVPLIDAVWGAVGGYMSLWLVYWGFRLATGKEGMGFGDFKLFAALGAWFGWSALIPIILLASVIGSLVVIAMKLTKGMREGGQVPFGPFLAGAALVIMVFGVEPVSNILKF